MEDSTSPTPKTSLAANHSDSGIFSATSNTTIDQSSATNCDSDNRSDCSSPERKYVCPICERTMTAQHEFTMHIRSHNNEQETNEHEPNKAFTCKICFKVLSSSSSLDRHVLVHTGERPFQCVYCGDTFTTNGNMHRHMRTHSAIIKSENYESDASTESGNSKPEFNNNNNKIETKRKLEDDTETHNPKRILLSPVNSQLFRCPVCDRTDFNSVITLDLHLEDNHPEYPAKCNLCKQVFLNNKQLTTHKSIAHENNNRNSSVVGFKDLTFVDFSSVKFPQIAVRECEMNLHKASNTNGLKFQCKKCARAFPCSEALEIHERSCLETNFNGMDLTKSRSNICEAEIRRTDFFSRLDLQDNSPEKKPVVQTKQLPKSFEITNKDLADIPSILSNINLQVKRQNSDLTKVDDTLVGNKNDQEEESQDIFAVEFRKMKLRGEFPCRLCTAVFPNLRALKGHNRAHLNGNNNGTYYCNMCPHSSVDKAALIRHMRTHNGDRPYECSLCNYAFTTKANCERHLRNRHAKTTREEVKKSIIYHPSEDPTNDELNKLVAKDDKKPDMSDMILTEKIRCSTPKELDIKKQPQQPVIPDLQPLKPTKLFNNYADQHQKFIQNGVNPLLKFQQNFVNSLTPPQNFSASKIQVKNFETLKEPMQYHQYSDEDTFEEQEEPMNLVLDLSKKKDQASQPQFEEEEDDNDDDEIDYEELPQDLTKKNSPPVMNNNNNGNIPFPLNMNELFAQTLLKSQPNPASLFTTLSMYPNGFPAIPNWPSFPINPLLFNVLPQGLPHNPQEFKERMQRLQLCGGSVVSHMHQQNYPAESAPIVENSNKFVMPKKLDEMKQPLSLNIESPKTYSNENIAKLHSPQTPKQENITMHSPNSVKMVIKNGVLMPKQKQRRYRTERPFTCEHCSARFTLRSNMERHIKQQHPQFWSQRQRGNIGNPGRKPTQGLPLKPTFCDMSYDMVPKMQNNNEPITKDSLNEKIKFAILAQHLRASSNNNHHVPTLKHEADEEDCELVIDEQHGNNRSEVSVKNEDIRHNEDRLLSYYDRTSNVVKTEEDLVPVSRLLDNASQQQFKEYFKREHEEHDVGASEDEEGLVASGSTSEGNVSGTDENRSESENATVNAPPVKKKSAYSLAPNRVSCPYCSRKFPWSSSLRRHILTHTGQKPFKCSHCPLLFTTKSNCDRHLLRKHGNNATTISTEIPNNTSNNNSGNFLMRNVPERPFKCSNCPSSTFSTYSNLKKHISCKHATNAQGDDIKAQGYEAGSSEDEKFINNTTSETLRPEWDNNKPQYDDAMVSGTTDLPFKCHLCEGSFGERQDALDHIHDKHESEYELLMSKNALESTEDSANHQQHDEDETNENRGKFPDYSNRKVICAWCMRRFWSAEDLRRHMRTHTGERPFSCDICRRRFTLKHSMLRHRKKHNVNNSYENDTNASDDDAAPSIIKHNNNVKNEKTDESDCNEGGDLISNLLGLPDRSIIEKVLNSTADDAAKLLGVKNKVKE